MIRLATTAVSPALRLPAIRVHCRRPIFVNSSADRSKVLIFLQKENRTWLLARTRSLIEAASGYYRDAYLFHKILGELGSRLR